MERDNQEVLRHLNAILFDSQVHDKLPFEQLPMVQRIMKTVEKKSTGVTPAQLIFNNSISLSKQILMSTSSTIICEQSNGCTQVECTENLFEIFIGISSQVGTTTGFSTMIFSG